MPSASRKHSVQFLSTHVNLVLSRTPTRAPLPDPLRCCHRGRARSERERGLRGRRRRCSPHRGDAIVVIASEAKHSRAHRDCFVAALLTMTGRRAGGGLEKVYCVYILTNQHNTVLYT